MAQDQCFFFKILKELLNFRNNLLSIMEQSKRQQFLRLHKEFAAARFNLVEKPGSFNELTSETDLFEEMYEEMLRIPNLHIKTAR